MVDNASSNNTVIIYLKGTIKKWKETILGHEFLHMRWTYKHVVLDP